MAVAQDKPSTNAIVALVLGIVSWLGLSLLAAIPAWIIGRNELQAIDSGSSNASSRTMASIGMWLGIINVVASVLLLLVWLLFAGTIFGGIMHAARTGMIVPF
jgi:membrane-anchored glycerophosphoryl diester phosphodiesterase (GDPDase)